MMTRRAVFLLAVLAALSLGGYLWASRVTFRLGFPLDDAWIHQTYARNLVERGEWAFVPGQPSAGSTAPLWSALLAVGQAFGWGPLGWAFVLGWAALLGLAVLGGVGLAAFEAGTARFGVWAGAFLALEWHLVWAAGSGMETLPYALLVTLVLVWLAAGWGRWFWLGAVIGLLGWVRPDGVTLLAPAGVGVLLFAAGQPGWGGRLRAGVALGLGFALFFVPYLGFNWMLAGEVWPNTFFAKQAEYAVLRERFFGARLLAELRLPLVGAGALLLPGVVWLGVQAWRARRWVVLAGMGWWLGYAGLYAWRLPVTYQHGRYLMPAMPVFFLWGLAGMWGWTRGWRVGVGPRVLARAWPLSVGVVLLVFWGLGARSYALDVAVIESEMVETARWVAENTEADALIAAHDIGALGYFGGREIVDLAGLVSPEVIAFIRDEARLAAYLDRRGAAYLVTLEGWYPSLEAAAEMVYRTEGEFSPALGGANMVVYQWGMR